MFQDPLVAVMVMLLLCFAGMMLMFIFVIRSAASQAEEGREAFRKQQLFLSDLERQLMIIAATLRRLEQEKNGISEKDAEQSSSEFLPILRGEDPLLSMLEAAASRPEAKPVPPAQEPHTPLPLVTPRGRAQGQAHGRLRVRAPGQMGQPVSSSGLDPLQTVEKRVPRDHALEEENEAGRHTDAEPVPDARTGGAATSDLYGGPAEAYSFEHTPEESPSVAEIRERADKLFREMGMLSLSEESAEERPVASAKSDAGRGRLDTAADLPDPFAHGREKDALRVRPLNTPLGEETPALFERDAAGAGYTSLEEPLSRGLEKLSLKPVKPLIQDEDDFLEELRDTGAGSGPALRVFRRKAAGSDGGAAAPESKDVQENLLSGKKREEGPEDLLSLQKAELDALADFSVFGPREKKDGSFGESAPIGPEDPRKYDKEHIRIQDRLFIHEEEQTDEGRSSYRAFRNQAEKMFEEVSGALLSGMKRVGRKSDGREAMRPANTPVDDFYEEAFREGERDWAHSSEAGKDKEFADAPPDREKTQRADEKRGGGKRGENAQDPFTLHLDD